MARWRFEIEGGRGNDPDPPPRPPSSPEEAPDSQALERGWEKVREGRKQWLKGIPARNLAADERRVCWVGGALAVYAAITGEDPEVLNARLVRELPQPGMELASPLQVKPDEPERRIPEGVQRVVEDPDNTPPLEADPGLAALEKKPVAEEMDVTTLTEYTTDSIL